MNYKSNSLENSSINYGTVSSKQIKDNEAPLLINPDEYFQTLEMTLNSDDNGLKERKLNSFYLLTKKDDFIYYSSFSSSNLPSLFINILSSKLESDKFFLGIVLKIIANLSFKDYQYCNSFSTQDDIINILFDLFLDNICEKTDSSISFYSITSIINFSTKSIEYRDEEFRFIIPIVKYAQQKEDSQIKTNIFRFIFNLTNFEIDTDQLAQILNAIDKLTDFVDDFTSRILSLTLKKLTDYYDIYPYINPYPKIIQYLSQNLLSTQTPLVYITLLIFASITKTNSFEEIPDIPQIIKFLDSLSIDIIKTVCLVLTNIIENSAIALSEDDMCKIVKKITFNFSDRKLDAKQHLIRFLILILNDFRYLIKDADFEDFVFSITDCLNSDDLDLLTQTLDLLNVIATEELNGLNPEYPLLNCLNEEEKIEILSELKDSKDEGISRSSIQLSRIIEIYNMN